MTMPIRPAVPSLAGLQGLLERQRTALMQGQPDDLPALGAQLQLQMAQIKNTATKAEPPPTGDAARAEIEALQQLAAGNMALLQRRLVETQNAVDALGAGVPALEESRARATYEAAGRMDGHLPQSRALGRA